MLHKVRLKRSPCLWYVVNYSGINIHGIDDVTPSASKLLKFVIINTRIFHFTDCVFVMLILMKVYEYTFYEYIFLFLIKVLFASVNTVFRKNALGLFPNNIRFRAHRILRSHLLEVSTSNTVNYSSRYQQSITSVYEQHFC